MKDTLQISLAYSDVVKTTMEVVSYHFDLIENGETHQDINDCRCSIATEFRNFLETGAKLMKNLETAVKQNNT